jgi:hypothetical protein
MISLPPSTIGGLKKNKITKQKETYTLISKTLSRIKKNSKIGHIGIQYTCTIVGFHPIL